MFLLTVLDFRPSEIKGKVLSSGESRVRRHKAGVIGCVLRCVPESVHVDVNGRCVADQVRDAWYKSVGAAFLHRCVLLYCHIDAANCKDNHAMYIFDIFDIFEYNHAM